MKRIRRFAHIDSKGPRGGFFLLTLAALVLSGCSGGSFLKSSRGGDVFPYSLGVFLKVPTGVEASPALVESLAGKVCVALEAEDALVSRAVALSATTTQGALREGRNMDFLVGVSLAEEKALPEPEISNSDATLEVLAWLFGGLPSWFVATHEYPLSGEMELEVIDLNDREVRAWMKLPGKGTLPNSAYRLGVSGGSRSLSLVDRSAGSAGYDNYLLSIVMPPMFIAGEPEAVITALNEEASAGFLDVLKGKFRAQLEKGETERSLRVVFPRNPEAESFSFEVISEGAFDIRVLDLHRLARGSKPYRLVLKGAELSRVNQELKSEGRARIDVPGGIPVVAGTNLVKVRALRNDGTRISRTVVMVLED